MTETPDAALTCDAFLGGRVSLWQPRRGYRAGVDPVLLAAACPARPGESVLELGCGVGAASLCLATRVPGLALTGIELQPEYADLARRNAAQNDVAFAVVTADLAELPADLRQRGFDHVIANPPYYMRARSTPATLAARETALGEGRALAEWIDVATRRLVPKGYLTFILKAVRLPDALAGLECRAGSIIVRPIQPRHGRAAELVLVQARKGGRADFRLAPPLTLHAGARHERDGDDYTPEATAILRNAAAFSVAG